nr:MAG TPA: Dec protein, OB-Fold, Decoration, VIRAL PROTEIN [Caudoviricetes sp.]
MAKGNPNDSTMKNNFVAKVYDPALKTYRPIYVAPDATDNKRGEVWLSDATNGTDNAAAGVVAATPKAVKTVNDNANNKLDKTTADTQSVKSPTTFAGRITGNGGFMGNLTGNVTGNADTATKLKNVRSISVKGGNNGGTGSANFDGSGNILITIPSIDATSVTGVLPLNTIPQGALERLVHVANEAARFKLTTTQVQTGDSVIQDDTDVMYIVVDDTKLNTAAGYQEYKARTALNANHATNADNATNATTASKVGHSLNMTVVGGTSSASTTKNFTFNGSEDISITIDNTRPAVMNGASASTAGSTGLVPAPAAGNHNKFLRGDGTWQVAGEVTGVKGDAETSYRKGSVNLTCANIGAATVNHNHDTSYLKLSGGTLTGNLIGRTITPSADNSYNLGASSAKWSYVYATKFVGNLTGNVEGNATSATNAQSANKFNNTVALRGDITASATSFNTVSPIIMATTIGNGKVTSAKIADKAITNSKLADNVGTVYVGTDTPTEEHIKLWVKI